MESLFGNIIEFENDIDFESLCNNMTKDESITIIKTVFDYMSKIGVLNIKESYLIYKCLLKIKEQ